MANFRYFVDRADGTTIQLDKVAHNGSTSTKAHTFFGYIDGEKVTVSRAIERKSFPSNHVCDARCQNAKGFKCECSCGGKNHGKGQQITCEAA
jgi:hypothetical protein